MHSFYTLPEYESWRESLGPSAASWEIKYYKGLGTSSAKEAKEYFAAMDHHKKHFVWDGKRPVYRLSYSWSMRLNCEEIPACMADIDADCLVQSGHCSL